MASVQRSNGLCIRTRTSRSLCLLISFLAMTGMAVSGCAVPGTSTAVDTSASILGWSPGITRSIPLSAPLSVFFTRSVNHGSVERSWSLTPKTPGTFHWAATTLSFMPARELRPGTYYRLSVGHRAQDEGGRTLSNALDVAFSTGDPLKVLSVTPGDSTTDVPLNGLISVTFNHPIVALAGLGATSSNPSDWHVSITPRTAGHGRLLLTATWVFHPNSFVS